MDRYKFDYGALQKNLEKNDQIFYDDVKDQLEKVAFDVVRFRSNDDTPLYWKVVDTQDGPVLEALYDENGGLKAESDWQAIPDKKAVHVYYKGEPITKLAAQEIGIKEEELSDISSWLPARLSESYDLRKSLLNKLAKEDREMLREKYPELRPSQKDIKMSSIASKISRQGRS